MTPRPPRRRRPAPRTPQVRCDVPCRAGSAATPYMTAISVTTSSGCHDHSSQTRSGFAHVGQTTHLQVKGSSSSIAEAVLDVVCLGRRLEAAA